jgi:hypothetical protein
MSGWVHLGLNSCRIQTVCLHLIGSVLMFSPVVLSLSFWLLAMSHRSCAFYPRFSFSVPRFRFMSSGFAFLVLSSIPQRYVTVNLYVFLASSSFVRWLLFVSLSSAPRRFDVHLLLMSRMGSGRVGTHAGFRWCASSIGSVSTVLSLLCRQVLALIVPPRLRFISSGRWR